MVLLLQRILRSHWHEDLLARQKRLEFNLTVRNLVRFIAYFLAETSESEDCGLRYKSLVEFNARNSDEADVLDDDADDAAGEAAA